MSSARETDQKDYDLEQLVKVIDSALTSDNVAVQNALRSLLLVATIVSAEHPDQTLRNGPLARVFEDYHNLARRLSSLEDDVRKMQWDQQKKQVEPYMPTIPTPRPPPFGPNPITGQPSTNDPTKPTPMWESTWSAGDDPNYKGASSKGIHNV
jgi:hypothetical protein